MSNLNSQPLASLPYTAPENDNPEINSAKYLLRHSAIHHITPAVSYSYYLSVFYLACLIPLSSRYKACALLC